jgi:D-sedoheptulose 7-phosphate isomerase
MHTSSFLKATEQVCTLLDKTKMEILAQNLSELKGRLFVLGLGGSAANASHAVNDFRKLCGIEAYAPTDNISEFTARINDDGFNSAFSDWLRVSRLGAEDALLIFSVGGGQGNTSRNLVEAIDLAKSVKAIVLGVVGKSNGYTAEYADVAVVVPLVEEKWITPLSEAFQAIIWHCLVSHPLLQKNRTKW